VSRTRRRRLIGLQDLKYYERFYRQTSTGGPWVKNLDQWRNVGAPWAGSQNQQITVDDVHTSFLDPANRGGVEGDIGGEFYSLQQSVRVSNVSLVDAVNKKLTGSLPHEDHILQTPIHAPVVGMTAYPTIGERDLIPVGATAIARAKPTNSVVSLFTDFSEFYHEGLPSLWGVHSWENRTNAAKAAGGEYLNQVFGWEPLIRDVRGAAYAAANAHRLLEAYAANSGKVVRRKYEFPVERTRDVVDLGARDAAVYYNADLSPVLFDFTKPQPHVLKETSFYRKTWFSGAFTYHLPVGYNSHNAVIRAGSRAGPLLGIELTPDTLWNASPWTWALDWISNAGDVVSNLSDWATDGLAMKWGYLMEHSVSETTFALDRPARIHQLYGGPRSVPVTTVRVELKRRIRATPFGFGLSWNSFSPRQLAIAAALGLTRLS
jgi:hypothetical protein